MASFIVMERATGARPALDGAPVDATIVRDGFSLLAFLVPIVWFLFHRMWIEALVALALTLLVAGLATYAGFGQAAPWLSLLVSLYAGLEAQALRASSLRRRGWRDWGVVEADDAVDAETRYLAEAAATWPAVERGADTTPATANAARPGPALGLFAYPGHR